MSTTLVVEPEREPDSPAVAQLRTDTLASSVAVLLALTVVQRLVGFLRGVLFCRWLDPGDLGQWDMILAFLELAAPAAVLGVPGSFGRYVEYYRQRGQLRTFLRRTTGVSIATAVVAITLIVTAAPWFSRLVFGVDNHVDLIYLIALCLGAVIVHNFVGELFASLRMFRVASLLQFAHGLLFATLAIGLLVGWRLDSASVVLAYGGAYALCSVGAIFGLRSVWRSIPPTECPMSQQALWSKLVPFAVWIWLGNWLTNLFVITDRYMIVHFSGLDAETSLQLVGQYHSSRILPVLLVSIVGMLSTMIIPHLSHDWESGRRDLVARRMQLTMKLVGLSVLGAASIIDLLAPTLFQYAFADKFSIGLSVLPGTLMYCTWFAMVTIIQIYLWCAERARLGSLALTIGLVVNICLNLILLPRLELFGAVLATSIANAITLIILYLLCRPHGLILDRGAWVISAAPLLLFLPAWATLLGVAVLLALIYTTDQLLDRDEKQQLLVVADGYVQKISDFRELFRNTTSRRR